jgi:hypothetical protein
MPSIFEILKLDKIGMGNVQSVDEMTVIPLVGSDSENIASPSNLQFERTTTYGSMKFSNKDDEKPVIIPTNMMIRGSGAQDHAMVEVGIIAAKGKHTFTNACCIEETQGGYLSSRNNEEDILPIQLRKVLTDADIRRERSYSKLWSSIKSWMSGLRLSRGQGRAHLRDFYDDTNVKQALEDFAAEFEPIEGQIGAVILFNGIPVGLEIMPSNDHWNTYWKHLIRGCYGAELLRLKTLGKLQPSTLVLPDIPEGAEPEEVQSILESFTSHLREEVIPLLENININISKQGMSCGGLVSSLVTTPSGGGGDIVLDGDEPIYLSLVI